MPRPRCLLFDFGNVIAFFDHLKACRQLAALARTPVDSAAVYAAVFGGRIEEDYDSGRLSTREFVATLRRVLDLDASDIQIGQAWSDIYTPNEAVIGLIPALRSEGIRLVLGSNTNELHHDWFSRQFADTLAAFDAQVLSHRVGCRKPDHRFFDACLAAAHVSASDCLYIDDRADFIAAAHALGIEGIVYTPGYDLATRLR